MQRDVGDCFFVASMSAVAQNNPKAIKDAFRAKADGTWDVRIYDRRGTKFVPTWVNVDNNFPKDVYGDLWYTSGKNPKELWPALLEKAMAIHLGGYDKLDLGGSPQSGITAITGTWTNMVRPGEQSSEQLFKTLAYAVKNRLPMATYTRGDRFSSELKYQRLVADHAYSVLWR